MKKLILITIVICLGASLYSQSIDGKLGFGGLFIIRDTNNIFLQLSQTSGNLNLFRGLDLPNSTASNSGAIFKSGLRFLHNYGSNNTFLGLNSGNFILTGSGNTAVGTSSLQNNTSGVNNTAIGFGSLQNNTSGVNNTAIGYGSLHFNSTDSANTALGHNALYSLNAGSNNTAIGDYAGLNILQGSNNTVIGDYAGPNILQGSNNITLGYFTFVPNNYGSNQVRIGNDQITYAGVQVAWTITSDRRWKSDIKSSPLGLSFISKLNPVSYFRTNDEKQKTEYGFIAQEVEGALNESGAENTGMITIDDAGKYEMRYNDLLAPMVKAIQELNTENEKLKSENDELKQMFLKFQETQSLIVKKVDKLETNARDVKEVKLGEK